MRIIQKRDSHIELKKVTCNKCRSDIELDLKSEAEWQEASWTDRQNYDPDGRGPDTVTHLSGERAWINCPNCNQRLMIAERVTKRRVTERWPYSYSYDDHAFGSDTDLRRMRWEQQQLEPQPNEPDDWNSPRI